MIEFKRKGFYVFIFNEKDLGWVPECDPAGSFDAPEIFAKIVGLRSFSIIDRRLTELIEFMI